MQLHELELRKDFYYDKPADENLRQRGFKQEGHGQNSRVYSHPKFDYLIKIFRTDPCYLRYVALAMSMPNPHFPKFRGKLTKIVDEVYAIRMERLDPYEGSSDILLYIEDAIYGASSHESAGIRLQFPELDKACNAISRILGNHCHMDMHEGNIMQRGNIPVIIDPISI